MLLDFGQLNNELELISGLKPLPHKAYVETYIKAYYLPESCLESWVQQHPVSYILRFLGLLWFLGIHR